MYSSLNKVIKLFGHNLCIIYYWLSLVSASKAKRLLLALYTLLSETKGGMCYIVIIMLKGKWCGIKCFDTVSSRYHDFEYNDTGRIFTVIPSAILPNVVIPNVVAPSSVLKLTEMNNCQ